MIMTQTTTRKSSGKIVNGDQLKLEHFLYLAADQIKIQSLKIVASNSLLWINIAR